MAYSPRPRLPQVATGHNADDMAETVLLNLLRGDVARLGRSTCAVTGEDGDLPRVKPFMYSYEKEIVMYAYFKKWVRAGGRTHGGTCPEGTGT